MRPWSFILLMLLSGGYLFADVAFLAAQGARDAVPGQNTLIADRLANKYIGGEQQQEELGVLPEKAAMPRQLAQNEQKQPERPILKLRPDIGTAIKSRIPPPPPPAKPWYTEATIIVALISAAGAIVVALLGFLRRGRSE